MSRMGHIVKLNLAMCRRIVERAGPDWKIWRKPKRIRYGYNRNTLRGPDFVALHCRGYRVPLVHPDVGCTKSGIYHEAFSPHNFKRRFEEFCAREPGFQQHFIAVVGYEPREKIEAFERSEIAICMG